MVWWPHTRCDENNIDDGDDDDYGGQQYCYCDEIQRTISELLGRTHVCLCVRALCECVHRLYDVSRLLEPGIFLSLLRTNEKCEIEKKNRSHLAELDAIFIYFWIRETNTNFHCKLSCRLQPAASFGRAHSFSCHFIFSIRTLPPISLPLLLSVSIARIFKFYFCSVFSIDENLEFWCRLLACDI